MSCLRKRQQNNRRKKKKEEQKKKKQQKSKRTKELESRTAETTEGQKNRIIKLYISVESIKQSEMKPTFKNIYIYMYVMQAQL